MLKLPSPVKRPSVFAYNDSYKNESREITQASGSRQDFNSFIERNFSHEQSERRIDSVIKVEPSHSEEARPYHEGPS